MIILIADSGSTTTDWALINNHTPTYYHTAGINPVHQDRDTICETLAHLKELLGEIEPTHIFFYGAGCVGGKVNDLMASLVREFFVQSHIEIYSDLMGAARSLCGRDKGIAGILGTGANSCYYNGNEIVDNVPPLGYILGDEGSGASLGKAFLCALLRKTLGEELLQEFYDTYNTDYQGVIRRIYREPAANRYLASISPFIAAHIEHEGVFTIVYHTLSGYIENHIKQYDYKHNTLHLTGSVAYYYRDIIGLIAKQHDITLGNITRTPIDGLITYHTTTHS